MKKLVLLFMLGVVVISGYQLTEGVIDSATENEYPGIDSAVVEQ